MGKTIADAVQSAADMTLAAASESASSQKKIEPVGGIAAVSADKIDWRAVDVLIDFTTPSSALEHLACCKKAGVNAVVGTTGLGAAGERAIAAAAKKIAVVFAPNMSVGVNVLFSLLPLAARALGEDYDAEISEAHHRGKRDAPSGTALKMGEILARAAGKKMPSAAAIGSRGGIRKTGEIGFSVMRGGEIVGEHTALFAGPGERLEITHRAASRTNFALGALRAARFLHGKKTGLFDMQDVLGLREN